MRIAADGMVRASTGLNLRAGRGTNTAILAVLVKDALARVVGAPVGDWVLVDVSGWTNDGVRLWTDGDERSTVKATLRAGSVGPVRGASNDRPEQGVWRRVTVRGYVSMGFVTVVDGPPSP